jgi:Domain of unknown function (DUF4145)
MIANKLGTDTELKFSLSGDCPHCRPSAFVMVTSVHAEQHKNPQNQVDYWTFWSVFQCQGCLRYVLGAVRRLVLATGQPYSYSEHFPIGRPSDDIAEEIPLNISADFREALRCRFVDAHNATVEMCRRAVQAACIDLKAPADKKLVHQIDWLAEQGIITIPLKQMAHRVRLGGNLGAHPPEDPEDDSVIIIGPTYADAVIEFTRDFFQHVYVMPERLKKFTFSKKAKAAT